MQNLYFYFQVFHDKRFLQFFRGIQHRILIFNPENLKILSEVVGSLTPNTRVYSRVSSYSSFWCKLRGGFRVLKECIIKQLENVDYQIWANLQISEAKMAILGFFSGWYSIIGVHFGCHWWLWCFMFTLGIYGWCFICSEAGLLICTNKMYQKHCWKKIKISHFASVNQLHVFSINGILGEIGLKKLVE